MKKAVSIILTIVIIVLCVSVVWADDSHIHTYTKKQFERTCTEQGYSIYCCECGDTYCDDYVEPGHTWDYSEILKEPTATSSGQRKYKCTKCSFEKTVIYNGIITLKDVSYGDDYIRQSINIVLPKDVTGDCGLLLNICGEGWKSGDKSSSFQSDIERAKQTGVAVASLNYRYLSEETNLDDILSDITNALKKIKDLANDYGLNIKNVMLNGVSSGGHLSLLYAYKMKAVSPIEIACVYASCAPSDLSSKQYIFTKSGKKEMEETLSLMMGKKFSYCKYIHFYKELEKLSAQYYVDENSVPTCLVHGKFDTEVPYCDSKNLKELLDSFGVTNVLITLSNSGHDLNNTKDEDLIKYSNEMFNLFLSKYLFDYVPGKIQNKTDTQNEEHTFKKNVVKPCCNSRGYTVYTCTDCGKTYKSDYKKALSHKAGDWQISKNATCNENGLMTQKCVLCNIVMNRKTISKTSHKKVIDKAVIPSCTRQALTSGSHCANCNYIFEMQKTVSVDIHREGEWKTLIPSTLRNIGMKTTRCVFCGRIMNAKQ